MLTRAAPSFEVRGLFQLFSSKHPTSGRASGRRLAPVSKKSVGPLPPPVSAAYLPPSIKDTWPRCTRHCAQHTGNAAPLDQPQPAHYQSEID